MILRFFFGKRKYFYQVPGNRFVYKISVIRKVFPLVKLISGQIAKRNDLQKLVSIIMIEPWGIECVSKCLPWKELPWLHAQTIQLLIMTKMNQCIPKRNFRNYYTTNLKRLLLSLYMPKCY